MPDPIFYVALAHTDNFARFLSEKGEEKSRVSNLNLFPSSMKENLLFSMSYDSSIHYETMAAPLDPMGSVEAISIHDRLPRRVFADCGAFQFRNLKIPTLPDGSESSAESAWRYYKGAHLDPKYPWEEILLCSPDHIVSDDLSDEDAELRLDFISRNAAPFLQLSSSEPKVTAVGVIHGRSIDERIEQYEMFKEIGYRYVALGGMVPYSTKPQEALEIVAGIDDIRSPLISPGSILSRCRRDGIKLHIFGLNSPEWCRWWFRLGMDSFDGSKLSTEGAANGWYWLPNDGSKGREYPEKPKSVSELYQRIAVKKMGAEEWDWVDREGALRPIVPSTDSGVDTSCECPACQYLLTARCTSDRCWIRKRKPGIRHVSDPRTMGSTEHNMGRVAHNAHVMAWILTEIRGLLDKASSSNLEEEEWLTNWSPIR